MGRLGHLGLAVVPLVLIPGLLYALAEGWIDAGGGEKDLILIIPYAIWAFTFSICAVVMIAKGAGLQRWLIRSATVSAGVLVSLGVFAWAGSWLGIA